MSRMMRALLCAMLVLGLLAACTPTQALPSATPSATPAGVDWGPAPQGTASVAPASTEEKPPKYVFLFIGDGMSFAQVYATQMVLGAAEGAPVPLSFTQFPAPGSASSYDATSFIPDSAAAGTALACGVKTKSGTIGMQADLKTAAPSIAELLKANGKKVGIVTSVTLNNATPAAFYAHVDSRRDAYEIARQMAASGVDYFGGGGIASPTGGGSEVSAFTLLEQNGYALADTAEEIAALDASSGKAYAISPALDSGGAMPFALDAAEGALALADFVRAGIRVLDNEDGFFMMCESGAVDWACHANDAATAIGEVLALADAVQAALDFAAEHPGETLIVVTADHETGGMALGGTRTGYGTDFGLLAEQTVSYSAFTAAFKAMKRDGLTLVDVQPAIREGFGIGVPGDGTAAVTLDREEYARLSEAFAQSMLPKARRDSSAEATLRYGSYEPLTVTLTHLLNARAGVNWTTYMHTAMPVPVYAFGAGAERFNGAYDNTDIFNKLVETCGLG